MLVCCLYFDMSTLKHHNDFYDHYHNMVRKSDLYTTFKCRLEPAKVACHSVEDVFQACGWQEKIVTLAGGTFSYFQATVSYEPIIYSG